MGHGRAIAALGLSVLALAGCSVGESGQAAVSDEFAITQAEVDAQVRAVLEQVGQPPGRPPGGLALATTQRLVQDALFAAKADELGISITDAQVQQGRAAFAEQYGGEEGLVQAAGQSGIPAGALDAFVRTNLAFTAISEALGARAGDQSVGMAALSELSEAIDVRVAPRYGTWDDAALQIVPGSTVVAPAQPAQPDAS